MNIKDEMFCVVKTLEQAGIEYALCGGMAVIVHSWQMFGAIARYTASGSKACALFHDGGSVR
ncbi:MAG: hypothetical protein WD049_02050 [Candidatus Paceibacterota bacterium]